MGGPLSRFLLLMLLLQFPAVAVFAATPTVASSSAPVSDAVNAELKDSVFQSLKSLGNLSPQQKRIFDEEVLPDYPLFIKDYSRDGQKIQAQVDLDGIRSITRFVAPPGSKILLYLNVDPHCEKCTTEAPTIRKMMEARVERRGFAPVWVAPDELAAASIADLVGPRGTMGFLEIDMGPAPQDNDVENDVRYLAKTQMSIRSVTSYQDQAKLFDTDSFEAECEKLLIHAFTDLGSKADLVGISQYAKDDLTIEVSKISGFDQYRKLRDAIESNMKGIALVEQRKLSRGDAVFALKTRKSLVEITSLLKGMQLDGGKQAVVVSSSAGTIVMEMR